MPVFKEKEDRPQAREREELPEQEHPASQEDEKLAEDTEAVLAEVDKVLAEVLTEDGANAEMAELQRKMDLRDFENWEEFDAAIEAFNQKYVALRLYIYNCCGTLTLNRISE